MHNKIPDYFVIGAFRAGTTWLYKNFLEHPSIFVPAEKELHYFSYAYFRGENWYLSWFKKARDGQKIVDISPSYLSDPLTSQRIYAMNPNAKIICIIRNPIEQMYSYYQLYKKIGEEKRSFSDAIKYEKTYFQNVLYYHNILRYLQYFSRDNIIILLYDELKFDSRKFIKDIYNFLNVEYFEGNEFNNKINKTNYYKFKTIEKVVQMISIFLKRHNLFKIKILLNKTGLVYLIRNLNKSKSVVNNWDIDIETKKYIYNYLIDDYKELDKIIKIPIEKWFQ